jgi:hypothetical protein
LADIAEYNGYSPLSVERSSPSASLRTQPEGAKCVSKGVLQATDYTRYVILEKHTEEIFNDELAV